MGNVRWTVDPREVVALRFDDEDFTAALKASVGDLRDQLERLLGGPPADATFDNLVEDEVVIMARANITGREDDELGNRSQQADARKGIKVDVPEANVAQWGVWVVSVHDREDTVPAGLSDRNRRRREDAYGALPAALKDVLAARLLIHTYNAKRGALRDPKKTEPRPGGKLPLPTSASASGTGASAGENA